jgi:hypothetical protein
LTHADAEPTGQEQQEKGCLQVQEPGDAAVSAEARGLHTRLYNNAKEAKLSLA